MRVVEVGGEVNISIGGIRAGGWKMRKEAPRQAEEIVVLPFRNRGIELDQRTRP